MTPETAPASILRAGERVLLVDRKGRRYIVRLIPGQAFHTHMGVLPHDALIGTEEGHLARTSHGQKLLVVRPTLADTILQMPRATQVIYPKDIGPILVQGDIFPGARVVEAGLGSGALTMALLRAVGERGQVTSYEVRGELVEKALRNIRSAVPEADNLTVKVQDIYESGVQEAQVDRLVLDLPEPWRLVASAAEALVPGGVFLSFLPTVLQVHQLVMALQEDGRFQLVETVEVMERPWYVTRQSVRPVHRMVAHTGFITTARRCAPTGGPAAAQDAAAPEAAPEGEDERSQEVPHDQG